MRVRLLLVGIVLATMLVARPAAAQRQVDLELVLAVDCSRSIDDREFALQIQGYAAAFRHPSVLRAIQSGPNRAIAVTYVQWAGPFLQNQTLDWTVIDSEETAAAFAIEMLETPRTFSGGGTSLSGIIDFGRTLFGKHGFTSRRRVIDISGDGVNNSGRLATAARDDAVREGITINGLAILSDIGALDVYFRDNVIGGDGAFVIAAEDFDAFAQAILNKLIREIAAVPVDR
ncbi:MAG TPA: DUF1194 domain-containing protein [Alphaproteobacteria bacterium]